MFARLYHPTRDKRVSRIATVVRTICDNQENVTRENMGRCLTFFCSIQDTFSASTTDRVTAKDTKMNTVK